MIDIRGLTRKDVGRWVTYTGGFNSPRERGRIKSWNDKYVFVVYKCREEWDRFQDFTGVATNPEELEFVEVMGDD